MDTLFLRFRGFVGGRLVARLFGFEIKRTAGPGASPSSFPSARQISLERGGGGCGTPAASLTGRRGVEVEVVKAIDAKGWRYFLATNLTATPRKLLKLYKRR